MSPWVHTCQRSRSLGDVVFHNQKHKQVIRVWDKPLKWPPRGFFAPLPNTTLAVVDAQRSQESQPQRSAKISKATNTGRTTFLKTDGCTMRSWQLSSPWLSHMPSSNGPVTFWNAQQSKPLGSDDDRAFQSINSKNTLGQTQRQKCHRPIVMDI